MARQFEDRPPDRLPPLPKPSGWFEVFCCGSMVLALVAALVVVALIR